MEPFFLRRSTIILLISGFLVVALILALKLVREPQEIRQRATAPVSVFIDPSSVVKQPGETFTVTVRIDSGSYAVNGADIFLSLPADTSTVKITRIEKGTFFDSNYGAENEVTDTTAHITVGSMVAKPGSDTDNELAIVTLTAVDTTGTPVAFEFGEYTAVSAPGVTTNVLTSKVGSEITIAQMQVSPTPTPSPSPTPTPTPTPTPSPSSSPSPSPSSTPAPSPSGSPLSSSSTSPSPSTSSFSACEKVTPGVPGGLTGVSQTGNTVSLGWNGVSGATHYGIVYGTQPGSYIFGAADIGNVTSFTVEQLRSLTTYYFAVFAVNDCAASGYSNEMAVKTGNATGGAGFGLRPTPTPVSGTRRVSPTPKPSFVPLDPNVPAGDVPTFLSSKASPSPISSPVLFIPSPSPVAAKGTALTILSAFLSPLGIFVIVVLFLILFLYMRLR